jgi:hypothetical protein
MGFSHLHECMFGTGNRQLSIKYGLQKRLCQEHHQGTNGPHQNREYDLQLKREAQVKFIEQHGYSEWMKIFKRDYSGVK